MPLILPQRSPLTTQKAVLSALFRREAKTRMGAYNLAIFWTLLQPILAVIFLSLIFGFFLERTVPNIPYPLFILSGLLPFHMILKMQTSAMGAIRSNQGLLIFPQVNPMDCYLVRFAFEGLVHISSFFVFIIIAAFFGITVSINDVFSLFAVALCTILFGVGSGLIVGVVTHKYEEAEKLISVIHRPLLYVSAVIYPLNSLPQAYQEVLLLNPLVHVTELTRMNIFSTYNAEGPNLTFLTFVTISTLAFGLLLYHTNEDKLRQ